MAFREYTDWTGLEGGEIFAQGAFNIDMAVGNLEVGTGKMAANRPADMQLIYYLLYVINRDGNTTIFPAYIKHNLFNYAELPPNANYASQEMRTKLSGLIWSFQNAMILQGKAIHLDGRCDRGKGKVSSLQGATYTIYFLNYYYSQTIKTKYGRDDWQEYLLADQLLPQGAKQEIKARMLVSL